MKCNDKLDTFEYETYIKYITKEFKSADRCTLHQLSR